jgi:hypothetical protein
MSPITSSEISGAFFSLDKALKSRWKHFVELRETVAAYKPKTVQEYESECAQLVAELQQNDPSVSDELAATRLSVLLQRYLPPHVQRFIALSDLVMSEYVIVAFLSHALCESQINATLAVGLADKDLSDLFAIHERADFLEKWLNGPKSLDANYCLPKGSALFETLKRLNVQRNAFLHHKISLSVNGAQVHPGTRTANTTINSNLDWIHRYFSLPYDLARHIEKHSPANHISYLFNHAPISPVAPHAAASFKPKPLRGSA